ncbi:acetyltransferase family protein [Yersinia ruckeri]|uniref:N-acetyltransferase n=1 Tax=Yersinia ruckeri TaxID=29486 RepID=UPI0005ACDE83|nr:N-acetyltransferase [Yersinia ruckeri]AJI95149.1 acetyltransferase family protein [Yersinia ruckeri]MCW6567164.1 N-acetyltransferase [Yersinia ruckeri]
MIRQAQPEDQDTLMKLWLPSTIAAHPFVPETYWHESAALVRNTYLPQAISWIYQGQDDIYGFISILNEQLIGALFVRQNYFGQNIGQALMQHAQAQYPALTLEVYQKNQRAYHFYRKQGFTVTERTYNEETQNVILTMQWQCDQYSENNN